MPVKTVIEGRVPVKIWTDDVEPEALKQLENTARLPVVFKHVAVMPDVHLGIGATIGAVVATKGAVIPAAVGVDIGCGMCAVELKDAVAGDLGGRLPGLRLAIERAVPTGFHENRSICPEAARWDGWERFKDVHPKAQGLRGKALAQLGSLGGGNHFIEVCVDSNDAVWVMLHSGSRHVGKSIADIYIARAKGIMRGAGVDLPDQNLAYIPEDRPEFAAYMHDVAWCQEYAARNREIMMSRVLDEVAAALGRRPRTGMTVNCHHNFAAVETHFGSEVLVTRKGAVRAGAGEPGIIPGSMGSRSFIVRGLGNPESFMSCSHGAGRRMSRQAAKRRFTLAELKEQTRGIECRKDGGVLDEIPGAYKPIERVMKDQEDLVEVVAELRQVLCVKG